MDQKALTLVVNGHSFIITGQCGTGKTFLLKQLIKDLIFKHHKNVGVTATTGMASSQLSQEATTLHHWSGIMDGRYDKKQLAELFDNDDKFAAAKSRIKQAECLVIDEISMLSKKTFELVEFVCRYVRKTSRIFGGLQIIGCGDFKQLPPVPNYKMQDDGSYCLESEIFKQTFPHHINLTEVVRQNEPDLVQAVHELCDGDPSEETIQLLKSLDRPLPDDVQITHLHGTNFDVNYINHEMLDAMEGREFQFKAKDEGPRNLLCHITAQKTLLLKEGAPIIFLRNIQDGLFNGARGTVQSLQQDSPPIVKVNGKLITLSPYIFDVYDVNQHKVVASRTQYPIMLAFALTVHRAQGQTLDFVNVDCASFFAPGQLGVAVGRVQRKAGLRIENFNRNAANLKHPKCVYEFYNEETFVEASDDLLCCMSECLSLNKPISPEETDDNLASNTQSDFELDIELPQLQHNRNINDFLQENKDTSFISCVSEDLCNTVKFEEHVNFLYFKVHEITSSPFRTKTSQQWNDSYADLNKFLISEEHINACRMLFNVIDLSKQQNKFSSKLMMWLLDREIADKAKEIVDSQKQTTETNRSPKPHSSAGEAKLRYIAGACISKITKRLKISVLQKIGQTSKKSKIARKFDYKMQKMLRQFRINEDEATQDSTMSEINYKQGPSRGLTIVNDNVFHFFY